HAVVHPGAGEWPAGRLRLRDLVLVMGEEEVRAAAVDREGRPQLRLGHHRALDMPGGTATAPGRVPARVLPLLVRFPEREVEPVLLQRLRARLLALVHVLGPAVGELAVTLEAADAEVDVTAGLVGV